MSPLKLSDQDRIPQGTPTQLYPPIDKYLWQKSEVDN